MTCELSRPVFADLYITHFCNLACDFCYYRSFRDAGARDLSTDAWKAVIDELAAMQVLRVSIPGGEPFVRPDILELLKYIVANRMRLRLNTNGTLLDEKTADRLADIGHFDTIQISLDGMRDQHDAIRGHGCWDKSVHAVRLLKARRLPVAVNMVLTAETMDCCEEACRFLCGELGVDSLRVMPVNDIWHPLEKSHTLSIEQIVELVTLMRRLAAEFPALEKARSPFLVYYQYIMHPRPAPDTPCRRCSLLWSGVTIRADGAIICCPDGGDKVIGHVGEESILEAWRNSPLMSRLREEALAGRTDLPEKCAGCEYGWYCRQNCVAAPPHPVVVCLKELKARLGL